eukprot:g16058.t1
MVSVHGKRCGDSECAKRASHGKTGDTEELCAPHAKPGMVYLKYKKRADPAAASSGQGTPIQSTSEGRSTARRVRAERKRKTAVEELPRLPLGSSEETNKRTRQDVGVPVSPSAPSAGKATEARRERVRRGPTGNADRSASERDSALNTEAHGRISCKAEPSQAQGGPNLGRGGALELRAGVRKKEQPLSSSLTLPPPSNQRWLFLGRRDATGSC